MITNRPVPESKPIYPNKPDLNDLTMRYKKLRSNFNMLNKSYKPGRISNLIPVLDKKNDVP